GGSSSGNRSRKNDQRYNDTFARLFAVLDLSPVTRAGAMGYISIMRKEFTEAGLTFERGTVRIAVASLLTVMGIGTEIAGAEGLLRYRGISNVLERFANLSQSSDEAVGDDLAPLMSGINAILGPVNYAKQMRRLQVAGRVLSKTRDYRDRVFESSTGTDWE